MFPILVSAQESGTDAVVSPVKMNVLYRGLPNPIEIAVPGVTSDKVTATITNGTIKQVTKGWEVMPGDLGESVITVLVNNKKVSEKTFRIKNVPLPVAVFTGKNSGSVSKEIAIKAEAIDVELKNFDWDLKFVVASFTFLFSDGINDFQEISNGNKLTDKMKSFLSGFQSGQTIVFKDIRAIGPDGRIRELSPVILKIE